MTYCIHKYQPDLQTDWDRFVKDSANGTFLHQRAYMDYHQNRFEDYSLMVYKDDQLQAVLPAHQKNQEIFAHNGLTYSDLLFLQKQRLEHRTAIISAVFLYLLQHNFSSIHIKTIPAFFHKIPNDANSFLYFNMQGDLRQIKAFFVLQTAFYRYNNDRKKNLKKLSKQNYVIDEDINQLPDFWQIVTENLNRTHHTKPVHNLAEIQLLAKAFPNEIKLFTISQNQKILGGALLYIINQAVHFQYIHTNPEKDKSVIDFLIDHIIKYFKNQYPYISFGTSATGSHTLNKGLAYWKESFGCQVFNQSIFNIDLNNFYNINKILQ